MSEPTKLNPPPSPNLSLLELIRLDDETAAPQNALAPCPQELPAVGGRRIDCSNATFERRALIALANEQAKLSPDNALIALYCDAVRLTREYSDAMNASLSPCPIKDEGEDTARLDWLEAHTFHGRQSLSKWANGKAVHQVQDIWTAPGLNLRQTIDAMMGKPEASPATTGKGPMESDKWIVGVTGGGMIAMFYELRTELGYHLLTLPYLSGSKESLNRIANAHNAAVELLSAPSEGRVTDEQGGLPVTPNLIPALQEDHDLRAALRELPAPTASEARLQTMNSLKSCHTFRHWSDQQHNSSSPALPLPLSEETKRTFGGTEA